VIATAAVLALSGTGAAGCGDDEGAEASAAAPPAAAGDVEVDIAEFLYEPETVTVATGSTVTWTNRDQAPHTATARDDSFDTGTLKQGDAGDIALDQPGTYEYFCRFHQFMNGTITVE
jgi:plastocyanin